jgi:hypothetical protein
LSSERVDRARLAGIGSTGERDLARTRLRQLGGLRGAELERRPFERPGRTSGPISFGRPKRVRYNRLFFHQQRSPDAVLTPALRDAPNAKA